MILDNEIQRQMLLQLIEAATIPGKLVEQVAQLKNDVRHATVNQKSEKLAQ